MTSLSTSPSTSSYIPNQKNNTNFAKVVKQQQTAPNFLYPKKDQGIIINTYDGLRIMEYIKSIGNIVGPKNVLFASRLANDRICMYLQSKKTVDQLLEKFETVSVCGHELHIRHLVTPTKKYYLARVCPSIPQEVLSETIQKTLKIKITSPIYMLRVGMEDPIYSHVLSFRRFFYGILEKDSVIPESFLVQYDGDEYRIQINTDTKRCFKCKQSGHMAGQCTVEEQEHPDIISNSHSSEIYTSAEKIITNKQPQQNSNPNVDIQEISASFIVPSENENISQSISPPRKVVKRKSVEQNITDDYFLPVQVYMSTNKYNFTYEQFYEYMEDMANAKSSEIKHLTNKLKTDPESFLVFLKEIHGLEQQKLESPKLQTKSR